MGLVLPWWNLWVHVVPFRIHCPPGDSWVIPPQGDLFQWHWIHILTAVNFQHLMICTTWHCGRVCGQLFSLTFTLTTSDSKVARSHTLTWQLVLRSLMVKVLVCAGTWARKCRIPTKYCWSTCTTKVIPVLAPAAYMWALADIFVCMWAFADIFVCKCRYSCLQVVRLASLSFHEFGVISVGDQNSQKWWCWLGTVFHHRKGEIEWL